MPASVLRLPARRRLHTIAEVEPGMSRLIAGNVLPSDTQPMHGIMHQRDQAIVGWRGAREDPQFFPVARACNDFFSPVSHDVGTETGIGFSLRTRRMKTGRYKHYS